MRSLDLIGLKRKIEKHRKANGYDLSTGWWDRVEAALIEELGLVVS